MTAQSMVLSQATPIARPLTAAGVGGGFDPASLFANGEVGAWYDPSDLSTVFSNVSVVGGVSRNGPGFRNGLVGDKSSGFGSESAEMIANPGFDTAAGWTIGSPADWAIADGKATYTDNGSLAYIQCNPTTPVVSGKWYVCRLTISGIASGKTAVIGVLDATPSVHYMFGGYQTVSANGVYDFVFKAEANKNGFRIYGNPSGSSPSWSVDYFSVKEAAGNHLAQTSNLLRPFESQETGAFQVFDGLDDFQTSESGGGSTTGFYFCTGIRVLGGAGTARTVWSDAGTNAGYIVRINASNKLELSAGNGASFVSVASAEDVEVGSDYVLSAWHDGANLNVRVNSGATATAAFVTATAGTASFTVGRDNGAATSYCPMRLYRSVYFKNSSVTADDRESLIGYCEGGFGYYSLPADDYDLFLLGGQSNAVGVGDSSQSVQVPSREGAEYLHAGSVALVADPTDHAFGNKSQTGSFLPAFAEKYYELTGRPVLFVSAARSGEGLTNGQWQPAGNLLPELGAKYSAALALVKRSGGSLTPRGMLWLGGESDAVASVSKATFKAAFIALLGRVRTQVSIPTLPILCLSIDSTSVVINQAGFTAIREAQSEACTETAGMELVLPYQSYYDNGFFSDSLHWNQTALNDAGVKAATACAALFP